LWDETEESFVWLLSTWLEAMSGVYPKTIITDQDAAMTNVIARVDKYGLQDNRWLQKIYSIRIPAYVCNKFCAGMSTTQRSECMNKFFRDFLNSGTSLSKFWSHYDFEGGIFQGFLCLVYITVNCSKSRRHYETSL
jgi:hypothetical protein